MIIRCLGDSNTYGYDPRSYLGSRYLPEFRWVDILAVKLGCIMQNDGMNGREIPKENWITSFSEDLLIVMLGTNDLLQGSSAKKTAEKMERFLYRLNPKARILLIAPPPLKTGEWVQSQKLIQESLFLGDYYAELAHKLGISFLDARAWNISLAYDGVHFTEEGHKFFAESLYSELNNRLNN